MEAGRRKIIGLQRERRDEEENWNIKREYSREREGQRQN
jgi:hypothetical protein